MLNGILLLLLCQFAGELLVVGGGLPIPGPVVGMVLLLVLLVLRGTTPPDLRAAAEGLLRHLALLYVPAGVGLMTHLGLVTSHWFALLLALTVSTAAGMTVTALVLKHAGARQMKNQEP